MSKNKNSAKDFLSGIKENQRFISHLSPGLRPTPGKTIARTGSKIASKWNVFNGIIILLTGVLALIAGLAIPDKDALVIGIALSVIGFLFILFRKKIWPGATS